MEDFYSEQEPSLSQLFDAIERKLDAMMEAFRYSPFDRRRLDYTLTMASPAVRPERPSRARFESMT